MQQTEMIFGTRPIIEAIQAGKEVDTVLVQKNLKNPHILEVLDLCQQYNIPVQKVPFDKLCRLTNKNHQGVICFLASVEYASLDHVVSQAFQEGKTPLILVLDRITDVRNFGAIVRTAECSGVHAIVVPDKGKARIGGDAFKTSAGALSLVPICRTDNLNQTILYLKQCGLQIAACTEKSKKTVFDAEFTEPLAIIMGSEEDGIAPEHLRLANFSVKIPIVGKISSLNVSVAAGVVLYEVLRQRVR